MVRVFKALGKSSLILTLGFLVMIASQGLAYVQPDADQPGGLPTTTMDRGEPEGTLFPNHHSDYVIINLTSNQYTEYTAGDTPQFPHGYYMTYPCFNADGTRLAVSARCKVDGSGLPRELWVMDYDPDTQTVSNFQPITATGGTGDIVENIQCSWSRTDANLLLFLELHTTQANLVKLCDLSGGSPSITTLYDPALDSNGFDATNPGFYATRDDAIVVGTGYNTGSDTIVLFDAILGYPSIDVSSNDKNLDPSSDYAGNRVTYYSTNATYGSNSSIFSDWDGSSWTEDVNGYGDPSLVDVPGLWAFNSGTSNDLILSLRPGDGWSSKGLSLFDGVESIDLLGDASATAVYIYGNHNWLGPNGEILFRAEAASHTGYGNNLCMAMPLPDEAWVDNTWTGPSDCGGRAWGYDAFAAIQDAIDVVGPGGTIHVASGTYEEQLHITQDDLTIQGAGVDVTTILSPVNLPLSYTTSAANYPIVFVDGCTGLNLSGLTVDGDGRGNANYRFQGIAFWNSGGSVTDVKVLDVVDTPLSGAGHGVGVYAYNNTGGPFTVNLTDVEVTGYQKGGIALNGDGLDAHLEGCSTIGDGPTPVIAQNGIQMWGGDGHTITDCYVEGNIYTGTGWAASGILLISAGTVGITDSHVVDGDPAVYCEDTDAVVERLEIDNNDPESGNGFYVRRETGGSSFRDSGLEQEAEPSPFGDGIPVDKGGRGTITVNIQDSRFTGQQTGYGLPASNYIVGDLIDYTVENSTVSNWCWGIVAFGSGGEVAFHLDGNNLENNGHNDGGWFYAFDVLTTVQDADGNWWGEIDPALFASDLIYGNIDYSPWLASGTDTSTDPGFQGDLSELWVDDDSPQAGAIGHIQEGIDLVDGSTVNIAAGLYTGPISVHKPVNLVGAGPGSTILNPNGSTPVFTVSADNVAMSGLEITSPTQLVEGIRISGASTGLALDDVHFTNLGNNPAAGNAYGLNVAGSFDDLQVNDCRFIATHLGEHSRAIGIFSGNSHNLTDFQVEDSVFEYLFVGVYLRSDIDGLDVSGCTFGPFEPEDCTAAVAGIYIGDGDQGNFDIQNVSVTGNDFVDYGRGVYMWNYSHGEIIGQVDISNNTFTNSIWSSGIRFIGKLDPVTQVATLEGPITIDGNSFVQNVDIGGSGGVSMIDFRTGGESATSQIAVTNNDITFTGPFAAATYGLIFRGPITNAEVSGNVLDGGGAGGATGGPPSTSGILVCTADSWLGPLSSSAVIDVQNNVINGFENGVAVYDRVAAAYGGIPAGAQLTLLHNSIYDNTLGVNTGSGEVTAATLNWWGDASGPYHPLLNLSGTGNQVTDFVDFDPWIGKDGGENVVCVPDPLEISLADLSGGVYKDDLNVRYLGGGSGMLYGYSIDVEWDNTVVSATTANFAKPATGPFASALLFQVSGQGSDGNGLYKARIDASLGGAHPGTTGPADLFQAVFTAVGTPDYDTSPVDVSIRYMRDNANQNLTGFYEDDGLIEVDLAGPSVTSVLLTNDTLAHTDDYVKDTDQITVTAVITDGGSVDLADITADLSGLGGGTAANPGSYASGVATWVLPSVTCTPADGAVTVTVTATDGLGNDTSGSDGITADNTAPTAVSGLAAAPGHNEVALSWDDASGTDDHYYGVMVRRTEWNDYPDYATAAPAYPTNETAGSEAFSGNAVSAVDTFDSDGMERDICYYQAFVYDMALNYGPADTGAQDRSTNYWLGDVRPIVGSIGTWTEIGNGEVVLADISALGATYYLETTHGDWDPHCDVGPTHDFSRVGIPEPDDAVDFEDLMIFSMNYGVVTALQDPQAPAQDLDDLPALVLDCSALEPGGVLTAVLRLADHESSVAGFHARLDFNPAKMQVLEIERGALLDNPQAFLASVPVEQGLILDGAALGGVLQGEGELVRVRFVIRGGFVQPALGEVEMRDAWNRPFGRQTGDLADLPGESVGVESSLPTHLRLLGAAPNPFLGQTRIRFELPEAMGVTIQIFDLNGRLVRTLANGTWPAGIHGMDWDGRNDANRQVGAGVYFCTLQAGNQNLNQKLFLRR